MRYFLTILLFTISLTAFGQFEGVVNYLDTDTIKGEDTIRIELPKLTGLYTLSAEILFEQVGGTSDGTGFLQAANDTIYQSLVSNEIVNTTPNDTINISDGAFYTFWLAGTFANNYRFELYGTANDTTKVIVNYIIKR
jgi:hypothetical protein